MTPHSPATDLAMHTAEPWAIGAEITGTGTELDGYTAINGPGWDGLAAVVTRMAEADGPCADGVANARRIVAAINACAGIPTEVLECDTPTFIAMLQERHSLRLQRDDLLAALKEMVSEFGGRDPIFGGERAVVCKARSALARAEGREVQG